MMRTLLLFLFSCGLAFGEDVRDLVNAWKLKYNEALELSRSGRTLAALDAAMAAAELAPTPDKPQAQALVATLAAELGDYDLAFATIDPLLGHPAVGWQTWWNLAISARDGGYPERGVRYAQAALVGMPKPEEAHALILSMAVSARQLDVALEAEKKLGKGKEPELRAALVRALIEGRRCDDARRVSAGLPADGDREALLADCSSA